MYNYAHISQERGVGHITVHTQTGVSEAGMIELFEELGIEYWRLPERGEVEVLYINQMGLMPNTSGVVTVFGV